MNCEQARELIGADPENLNAQLQEHLQTCPACREYHESMLALNAKLRRALEFDVRPVQRAPESKRSTGGAPPVTPLSAAPVRTRSGRWGLRSRGLSIGISLAAGLLVGFTLWLSRPQATLAAEIVTHVEGEPDSWSRTQPVSAAELEAVLRKSGVRLGPAMEPVVYASSCWFQGHFVPHFVVKTQSGPVTVMILMHAPLKKRQTFQADGFSGLLVPAHGGSIAILSRTPMSLDGPAREVQQALESG